MIPVDSQSQRRCRLPHPDNSSITGTNNVYRSTFRHTHPATPTASSSSDMARKIPETTPLLLFYYCYYYYYYFISFFFWQYNIYYEFFIYAYKHNFALDIVIFSFLQYTLYIVLTYLVHFQQNWNVESSTFERIQIYHPDRRRRYTDPDRAGVVLGGPPVILISVSII